MSSIYRPEINLNSRCELNDVYSVFLKGHWRFYVEFDQTLFPEGAQIRLIKEISQDNIIMNGAVRIHDGEGKRSVHGYIVLDEEIVDGIQKEFFVRDDLTYIRIKPRIVCEEKLPLHVVTAINDKLIKICNTADKFIRAHLISMSQKQLPD